jgi:hypothetical protein
LYQQLWLLWLNAEDDKECAKKHSLGVDSFTSITMTGQQSLLTTSIILFTQANADQVSRARGGVI